ncbi:MULTISPECIES: sensor domain-containing protein [Giesbergeria]|uniref:EAL domain-containing protein n=1 Tax=Giesbergeria sinuosa TaxID=80883 RepID=A0ABV9QI81_9BURK
MNAMDPLQALSQREQELLTTLEATGGGRWTWDLRNHQLSFHGDFYRPYGLLELPERQRTAYWRSLQHPDDMAVTAAQLRPVLSGKTKNYEVEFRVRNTVGSWRWVRVRGCTTAQEHRGRALRIVGIITDVTEQRATEEALRASEAKYNTIYQALPDPAGMARVADGCFVEVNPAFCTLMGLPRESIVGHTSAALKIWATPHERSRLMQLYQRHGKVDKLPMVAQRPDGTKVHGLMSAYPVPTADEECFVFVFHDITREQRIYEELQASNSLLQQAGRLARLGVWEDLPGRGPVYWSDVCYEIHGLPPGSPLPRDYVQRHVAPTWHDTFRNALRQCIRQRVEWNLEIEIVRADGRLVWMRALGEPVVEEGRVVRIRGVMQDIDASKRAEAQVREREALLSLTMAAASLGRWDWDMQTGLIQGDVRWRAMRGLHPNEEGASEPVPWQQCTVAEDVPKIARELDRHTRHSVTHFDATWRVPQHSGGMRWIRNLGKSVAHDVSGHPVRMLGVSMDVTPQHEHEQQLHRLAHHDALTGLPNRVLLARCLTQAMEQARTLGTLLGVAYLDLDGFKPVNDQHGHEAGDHLLVVAANRLTHALRATDCVARLGGDEFIILLPGLHSSIDCEQTLHHVMEGLAAPYSLGHESVTVTASIGYTLYPQDDADADTLLRHADQAMYHAKQAGRNRFFQFDAASERAAQQVLAHTARLHTALTQHQFVLYLQPKVDMRQGTVIGAEALVRWNHPEKGLLAPGSFLPQMQGTALETIFGAWVVDTALDMAVTLHNHGLLLPVSINIAAPHLQQADFADWLAQRMACYPQLPKGSLRIEITETAALYNLEPVAQTLLQLREMGVCTALDDFGTGYSSLTYLRRLPLETIKIDQSFVRGMADDAGDLAIVQGVIGLARSFDYRVIAEGVETVAQGSMLLQMGCNLAQGYCIAQAMPIEEFIEWVGRWQAPLPWQQP